MTRPGTDTAFDDAGRPVPTVAFVYPDDEVDGMRPPSTAAAEVRAAQAMSAAIVQFLVPPRRDPLTAGRRALALAFVLGAVPGVHSQRDLARVMKCSPPVASDLIRRARFSLWKARNSGRAA